MSEVSSLSLSEFDTLGAALIAVDAKIKAFEEEISKLNQEKRLMMDKVIFVLTETGKTSYQFGDKKVVISERVSVRTPKTEEDKDKFFSWLKSKGIEKEYLNINSQSLNSLYKTERELAIDRGDFNWSIPGIGEETITKTLSIRKG